MKNKTKVIVIKTKRMTLQPMTVEQLREKIENTSDRDMKQAYTEMLEGCENHEADLLWYIPWKMILKENNQWIGDLAFKGAPVDGVVEIGYGLEPEYEGKGYMTEAVKCMTEWAFSNEGVYFVEAETASDNIASQRLLTKNGFKPDGEGGEGPRYVLERPASCWMSAFMCMGLSIGLAIGNSMDNNSTGMVLGMCFGMAIGAALDSSDRKKRTEIRKKREESRKPCEESCKPCEENPPKME